MACTREFELDVQIGQITYTVTIPAASYEQAVEIAWAEYPDADGIS